MNAGIMVLSALGAVALLASLLYLARVNRRARQLRRPCRCPYCLGGGF